MYCKLFASLYQGTMRGRSNELLVFTNLLASCDKEGVVDKHPRAIADEVGIPVEEVQEALVNLESPDPESRTPDYDGARILRLDEHRAWGWLVVNYAKYRAIRNEDDRRQQNREAQARWRKKNKPASADVSHDKPRSAHTEAEAESIVEPKGSTQADSRPEAPAWETLWNEAPAIARKRSSKKQCKGAWGAIPAKDRPDRETALASLKAWKREWAKDDYAYAPGLHRWIAARQWENTQDLKDTSPEAIKRRRTVEDIGI